MTYTYDLATDIGKLRFLIKDTDISDGGAKAVFGDEELQFCLDQSIQDTDPDLYLAAAQALKVNAASAARLAKRKKMDVLSNDTTEIAKQLLMVAAEYERKSAETSAVGTPDGTSIWSAKDFTLSVLYPETVKSPDIEQAALADWWAGIDV